MDTSSDERARSRKASLQDDAYKKDMYLVFVRNALKEKSQVCTQFCTWKFPCHHLLLLVDALADHVVFLGVLGQSDRV